MFKFYKIEIVLTTILFISTISIYSQSIKESKIANPNKRYYIFNLDPAFVNFQYEGELRKNIFAGVGFGYGFGMRMTWSYELESHNYSSVGVLDNVNLEFFVTQRKNQYFSQTLAVFVTRQTWGDDSYYPFVGIGHSIFYGFKYVKIGHKLQFGFVPSHQHLGNSVQFCISPIILQIRL